MTDFDEEFPHIVGPFTEFENASEAQPGKDGLIETALIPMRDLVIYPNMVTPLFVERERSLLAIETTQREHSSLICAAQKDPEIASPEAGDLYDVGVEVVLGRTLRLMGMTAPEKM